MSCDDLTGIALMADGSEASFDGLASIRFKCKFDRIPNTIFFLQEWDIPGISMEPIVQPTPLLDLDQIGEKITYEPFTLTFLVDANMKNYKEIHDWMKLNSVGDHHQDVHSDAIIIINDSKTMRFVDCWPIRLGGLKFRTNATEMEYITCTVTFHYDWYDFI